MEMYLFLCQNPAGYLSCLIENMANGLPNPRQQGLWGSWIFAVIGRDAAGVIAVDTRRRVRGILESDVLMEELTNQIVVSSAHSDPEHFGRCELLVRRLRDGFMRGS
jgi:hypothetical protein